MGKLKEKLAKTVPALRDDIKGFVKQNADKVVSEQRLKFRNYTVACGE